MINAITKKDMCVGCGFCSLICPVHAISMEWGKNKTWFPALKKDECIQCGKCIQVCPNSKPALFRQSEEASNHGQYFGVNDKPDNSFFITFDPNHENRIKSASGGTTTALLKALIETGDIDCVICAAPRMAQAGEPHFELRICSSPEEIDDCRSSAYGPLRYDQVLKQIAARNKTCALVGLPCTMRAIKNLPPSLRRTIRYTVALMCSHNVTDQFSDFMAYHHGIKNDPFRINLRDNRNIPNANEYNTFIQTQSGKEIRTSRMKNGFTPAWRAFWFAQKCCLYCPDFYGADADLSVKDAWGRLSKDPLGITLCVVRNPHILDKLKTLNSDRKLHLEECPPEEILSSQSATARYKQELHKPRWMQLGFLNPEKKTPIHSLDALVKSITISITQKLGATNRGMRLLSTTCRIKTVAEIHKERIRKMIKQKTDLSFLEKASKELSGILKDNLEKLSRPLRLLPFTPAIKWKNKEGFHVLLTGGYGYGNVGDEAQLNTNIKRWKNKISDAHLTVLSPHPHYTAQHHGVHAEISPRVIWFNANRSACYSCSNFIFQISFFITVPRQILGARLMRAGLPPLFLSAEEGHLLHLVQRADILHISGGGFLTGMTRSRLWENALLLRLAHILNTPCILTGQTIGVFKSPIDRWLARWGLCHAKSINLRDHGGSEEDLKSIGISGEHVRSLYDDALFCEKCSDVQTNNALLQAGLNPEHPYIVVNYHYWGMTPEMKKRATHRFAQLCTHIEEHLKLQLLLLPMTPSDEESLKELQNELNGVTGILSYNYDFRIARGVISKAQWIFTMKHHPIIFAQGEGVPVISVCLDDYYYRKNKGAMANFNHEKYCMDHDRFFSSGAENDLLEFHKSRKFIQNSTLKQLNEFHKEENKSLCEIAT